MLKTLLNPKGSRVLFLSVTDWLSNHNNVSTACRKLLLLVRGVFGFLTVTSVYWSVHIMPLQDAAVLLFLSPCLVALASPFILGQRVNKAVFFSIPVAFIGVVLVAQPPALFGGEGLFLAKMTGPGKVFLQSLPLSRLAGRISAASGASVGESKGAAGLGGAVLGELLGGD